MRYQVLGPLRVRDGECHLSLGAQKVQTVLGVLLARAGRVATSDELMTEIWADRPPRRATAALHVYVSQLRKFLQRAGCAADAVVTRSPGYLLRRGDDDLDADVFQDLMNRGRAHMRTRAYEDAARCFERALMLWRGPVFGALPAGPILDGFATRMMELRLECVELVTDAHLEAGRHREIVGGLYSLIAEHPLREPFYRQLMIALYRSERRADALRVYQTARRTLNDELGLEPCRSLRDVHQAILTADGGPHPPGGLDARPALA